MRRLFFILVLCCISAPVFTQTIIKIKQVAPKIIVVRPVSPGPKFMWTEGRWKWNNKKKQYIWIDGQWIRRRKGHHWFEGYWENTKEGWKWVPGHWVKNHKNLNRP